MDRVAEKTLSVISWWLAYSEIPAEKLPDSNKLMTPHRYMCDIYEVSCVRQAHAVVAQVD
eukprot:6198715-Pleurochrysis_carterae.AAC.2